MDKPSKFKLGQKVFIMEQNTPVMKTIATIVETEDHWLYYLKDSTTMHYLTYKLESKNKNINSIFEDKIFKSIESLKKSIFG